MTKEKSGIYQIKNKIDGKFYIGSSKNLNKRWRSHKSNLRRNHHCNNHLQSAWNKYGEENFEFNILEEVEDINELKNKEQWYLDNLYPFDENGYNLCKNTNSYSFGHIMPDNFIDKMKKPKTIEHIKQMRLGSPRNKSTICFDKYGNYCFSAISCNEMIRKFQEIYKQKVNKSAILGCCNNKYHIVYDHIFLWENDYLNNPDILYEHINYKKNKTNVEVVCISLYFKEIRFFNSLKDAAVSIDKDNINSISSSISRCCNHKSSTSYNYFWLRKDEYELHKNDIEEYLYFITNKFSNIINCPIVQLDENYSFIKLWSNIAEIEKDKKYNDVTSIHDCINNKVKSSHGYRWLRLPNYASNKFEKYDTKIITRNRKIAQCDELNNLIKIWNNPNEIEKENPKMKGCTIRNKCNHKIKDNLYHGYRWYYLDEYEKIR